MVFKMFENTRKKLYLSINLEPQKAIQIVQQNQENHGISKESYYCKFNYFIADGGILFGRFWTKV